MNFNNLSNSVNNTGQQPGIVSGSNVSPFSELMQNPESVQLLSQMLQDPSVRAKLHLPNHNQQSPMQNAVNGTYENVNQTQINVNQWNGSHFTTSNLSYGSGSANSSGAQQSGGPQRHSLGVQNSSFASQGNDFLNLGKSSGTVAPPLIGQPSQPVQKSTSTMHSPCNQPTNNVSAPPPFPPPFLPPPLPPPGFPLSLLPPIANVVTKPATEVSMNGSGSSILSGQESSSRPQNDSREESSDTWLSPRRKFPGNSVQESRNSRAHAPYTTSPLAFESKQETESASRPAQKASVEKTHWTTNAAVKHLQKSSDVLAQFAKSLNQTPVPSIMPKIESVVLSSNKVDANAWPKEVAGSNCVVQEINHIGNPKQDSMIFAAQRKSFDQNVESSVPTRNASASMCGMSFPQSLQRDEERSATGNCGFSDIKTGAVNPLPNSSVSSFQPAPFPFRETTCTDSKPNIGFPSTEPTTRVSKPPFQPIKRTSTAFQGNNPSNNYMHTSASGGFNGKLIVSSSGVTHDDDRYESLISCDPCNKVFWTKRALEEHKLEHSKCPHPGCSFSANEEAVENHFANTHARGIHLKLDTPEEIRKWREQRRKHFPTKANVEVKRKQQLAKESRGETIETVSYSNCKARNQNNARGNSGPSDNQKVNESHQVKQEISNNSGFSRPPRLTSRQKYLSKFTRPGDAPKRPKFIEIKKEESDSEDSDAPPMEIPTGKVDPINVSATGPQNVPGNRSERSPVKEMNNNETLQRTYKPRPRKATLLEMLLAPDIRHERNVLMQCMYYIEQHKFFA